MKKVFSKCNGVEVFSRMGNWKFFNLLTGSQMPLWQWFCCLGGAATTGKGALWWVRRELKSRIKDESSLVRGECRFGGADAI